MTTEPIERQTSRALELKGRKTVEKHFSTLQVMTVEYISPDLVYPNSYNPNRQSDRDFELLLASMKEDGFTQPILVQKKTKEIIDGEHRWRAAQRLGLKEIPVVFTDMTAEQMRIATLRHNRARGSEDIDLTIKMLQDLKELGAIGYAIDQLEMSEKEINSLINDLPATEAHAGEQYNQAWNPTTPVTPVDGEYLKARNRIQASTPDVARMQQDIADRADSVEDEQERKSILMETNIIWKTVTIQLKPSISQEVLPILGSQPAVTVMRMVDLYVEEHGNPSN